MKKIIVLLLVVVLSVCTFAACSNGGEKASTTKAATAETTAASDESTTKASKDAKESTSATERETTVASKTPIEKAKISTADATDIIKSFPVEKLGLEGKIEDYRIMVSTTGKVFDGVDYLEVVASKVTKENEDGTVDMDTVGQYFVSYDGSKTLIRDLKTGKVKELK